MESRDNVLTIPAAVPEARTFALSLTKDDTCNTKSSVCFRAKAIKDAAVRWTPWATLDTYPGALDSIIAARR